MQVKLTYRLIVSIVYATSILFFSCQDQNNDIKSREKASPLLDVKPIAQDWNEIDYCTAKKLFDNFQQNVRAPFQTLNSKVPIPTSIFFPDSVIRRMAARIDSNGYSGIRVYYGAYDESMQTQQSRENPLSATVFFVETKLEKDPSGEMVHLDQFEKDCDGKNKLYPVNHGHMCPPDPPQQCKGAAFKLPK